jgi:hypothetical protein
MRTINDIYHDDLARLSSGGDLSPVATLSHVINRVRPGGRRQGKPGAAATLPN